MGYNMFLQKSGTSIRREETIETVSKLEFIYCREEKKIYIYKDDEKTPYKYLTLFEIELFDDFAADIQKELKEEERINKRNKKWDNLKSKYGIKK